MTLLRDERPDDADAIHEITQAAFADQPFSDGSEGLIIRRLRERGEMTLSLVIVSSDSITGGGHLNQPRRSRIDCYP